MKQLFLLYVNFLLHEVVIKQILFFEQFILSQEDITIIFKTLYGNIWYEEGGSVPPAGVKDQSSVTSGVTNASHHSEGMFLTLNSFPSYPHLLFSFLPFSVSSFGVK